MIDRPRMKDQRRSLAAFQRRVASVAHPLRRPLTSLQFSRVAAAVECSRVLAVQRTVNVRPTGCHVRNLDLDRLPRTCIFQPDVHELRWQPIATRQVCAGHQLIVEVRVLGRPRASDSSDDLPARDCIPDLRLDRAVLQMPERAVPRHYRGR